MRYSVGLHGINTTPIYDNIRDFALSVACLTLSADELQQVLRSLLVRSLYHLGLIVGTEHIARDKKLIIK